MGGFKQLKKLFSKGRSAAPSTKLGAVHSLQAPQERTPAAAPSQGQPAARTPSATSAASASSPQVPPPSLDAQSEAWVHALLGESDAGAAATAAEGLFGTAAQSRDLCVRLAAHRELLYRLRQVLRRPSDSSSECEGLQTYAAYLVSALAGASAAVDASLVANGMVPALASLLASTRSWGTKKGALRALTKLAGGSAEAMEQMAQCGALTAIAALLDSEDSGLIRRCLSIIVHTGSAAPRTAAAAMGDVVAAGGLGSLVRLAECTAAEVQADAVEALKLLSRLPETGFLLAEMGGIEALARVAAGGKTQAAQAAARVALQRLWEAAHGQPEGQPVLCALQAAGYGRGPAPAAYAATPGASLQRPTMAGEIHARTPVGYKQPQLQHYSPCDVLSPPGTAGSAASGAGSTARPPYPAHLAYPHNPSPASHTSQASSSCQFQQQQQQQPQLQHLKAISGGGGSSEPLLFVSSESALHLLPSGQPLAPHHSPAGVWALGSGGLEQQFGACGLGSGGGPQWAGCSPLSHSGSQASHCGMPGASAASSAAAAAAAAAAEGQDAFPTEAAAAPSSLLGEDQGWLIRRADISICKDGVGNEVKLGEGGFGTVLQAVMCGVDEVAVKRVLAVSPSAADLAIFTKEVAVLRSLHHRNIVQYYGTCMEPGSLFFVMELMKGGDLYSALRRKPERMAWGAMGRKVALHVALGLHYLHSRRPPLQHRDLKSPNILLSEEGVAKIADVGMVRPQTAALVTAQAGMTTLWAAPEVLRRERTSVKADIWSYGIIIWEVIAAGRPDGDITAYQPLALSRQMQALQVQGGDQGEEEPLTAAAGGGELYRPCWGGSGAGGRVMELPAGCPSVAAHIFRQCTQLDPALRPNAAQIVEWLRGEQV